MAVELDQFRFKTVQIYKSRSLGVGSYGAVYIAKCDQLPCAAKLLHPVLVDQRAQRNRLRFEQECQFLSDIRHPNIIQYLGTRKDPKSGLTVLLMELMDENLTNFLERSQEPLPYHLEINLCHDIALALAFLHSNGIIHRDLSSNNVLLIAGSRAKVTDFGTSMLLDASHQMTQCPGTSVYMSPEALREPPVYKDKLDCFSLGVLSIQITTRLFPDPGPSTQLVEDPRYPMGRIQVLVPETERRQSHTDLIDPNHPLLPSATQCLSYNEKDRPSARQLCDQLAAMKEARQYIQSTKQAKETGEQEGNNDVKELQRQVVDMKQGIHQFDQDKKQIKKELEQAAQKNWVLSQELTAIIQDKDSLDQNKLRLIQQNQQLVREKQQLAQDKRQLIQVKEQLMRALEQASDDKQQRKKSCAQNLPERCMEQNQNITAGAESQQAFRRGTKTTKSLRVFSDKKRRRDKTNATAEVLTMSTDSLAGQRCGDSLGGQHLFQHGNSLAGQRCGDSLGGQRCGDSLAGQHLFQCGDSLVGQQLFQRGDRWTQSLRMTMPKAKQGRDSPSLTLPSETSEKTLNTTKITWSKCSKVPRTMFSYRGAAAVEGYTAYFRCVKDIYAYNSDQKKWSILPQCPHSECALAIVKGLLTAIGGDLSSKPTNTLVSLCGDGSQKKWSEHFPPMPTKRYHTTAVCSGRYLIVAGGRAGKAAVLSTVEVMDAETHQWFKASSLPLPIYQASMTICGENLYMLGGYSQSPTKSVFTCSLRSLLQSNTPCPKLNNSLSSTETTSVWKNVADTPLYFSTCTSLCGELLAIGGEDEDHNQTTAVHKYDTVKNSWRVISHMATPRSQSLVAVLPQNKLMVVGGWTFFDNTKGSEIASIS